MVWLLVIAILIILGAIYLLRSEAPSTGDDKPPVNPQLVAMEARNFRDTVLRALSESTPGWSWEPVGDRPLEVSGVSSASGERRLFDLRDAFPEWSEARAKGEHAEAAEVIRAFVAGATGGESVPVEGSGGEPSGVDLDWVKSALSLRLERAGTEIEGEGEGLVRPVGALQARLVLRQPGGPEVATAEDLAFWQLDEGAAFEHAYEHLAADVEDGVALDVIAGTDAKPDAFLVAPGDPLAASYALVPALGGTLEKRLGGPVALWLNGTGELVAARAGAKVEQEEGALQAGPVTPGTLTFE